MTVVGVAGIGLAMGLAGLVGLVVLAPRDATPSATANARLPASCSSCDARHQRRMETRLALQKDEE